MIENSTLNQSKPQPPPITTSASEPVRYVGGEAVDKHFYHGGVRPAVGVHRYQAYRANRTTPPEGGLLGWTYNHAPMLAYWHDTFYLQYISTLKEEHVPPSRTLLMTSLDGRTWTAPRVLFPQYLLPEINVGDWHVEEGTPAVMHQRMGFYVAPNGRLLTLAFYSYCPHPRVGPNNGQGLGRVVREIYEDGSYGPVYFIRYNRHAGWNESNTRFPFYTVSTDAGFVDACESLLADKLMTLQWWEDDRAKDGFYAIDPEIPIKALSYYHRPDGAVVGLWKEQLAALSADEGHTWTPLARTPTIEECFAKTWGQSTQDGRYALVYNHSATRRNRFPLVVVTGDDGHTFDTMLAIHGEVSPMRFQGIHKNIGTQYIRGIAEGNGTPPGRFLWNTYSMNKEDIWVTQTRLPVIGVVTEHLDEHFDNAATVAGLGSWNLHVPKWAPISIAADPQQPANRCLELRDEDPYEYALAERAFPESQIVTVKFRVRLEQVGHGLLEFEVNDRHNRRALCLRFDPDWLSLDLLKVETLPLPITTARWHSLTLKLDCTRQTYDLDLDGKTVKQAIAFAEPCPTVERLVFRTGAWRGDVRPLILNGEPAQPGLYMEDLPGADTKVPLSIYFIDDVVTRGHLND
jgi:hypothetical protein